MEVEQRENTVCPTSHDEYKQKCRRKGVEPTLDESTFGKTVKDINIMRESLEAEGQSKVKAVLALLKTMELNDIMNRIHLRKVS